MAENVCLSTSPRPNAVHWIGLSKTCDRQVVVFIVLLFRFLRAFQSFDWCSHRNVQNHIIIFSVGCLFVCSFGFVCERHDMNIERVVIYGPVHVMPPCTQRHCSMNQNKTLEFLMNEFFVFFFFFFCNFAFSFVCLSILMVIRWMTFSNWFIPFEPE